MAWGDLGVFCVMIFFVIGCCWTAGWFLVLWGGVVRLASLSAQNIPLIVLYLGNIYTISGYQITHLTPCWNSNRAHLYQP